MSLIKSLLLGSSYKQARWIILTSKHHARTQKPPETDKRHSGTIGGGLSVTLLLSPVAFNY